MAKCNKRCLQCPYSDCVNNVVTSLDFLEIVELEKAFGFFLPGDEKYFYEDLLKFVEADRRREKDADRKRQERIHKKTEGDGHGIAV